MESILSSLTLDEKEKLKQAAELLAKRNSCTVAEAARKILTAITEANAAVKAATVTTDQFAATLKQIGEVYDPYVKEFEEEHGTDFHDKVFRSKKQRRG